MSHKRLFDIHNKQYLLCTCGNFHAIRSCQAKIWLNNKGSSFFMKHSVEAHVLSSSLFFWWRQICLCLECLNLSCMQFAQILKQLSGECYIHQHFKNHSWKLCKQTSRSKIKSASQMTEFCPKFYVSSLSECQKYHCASKALMATSITMSGWLRLWIFVLGAIYQFSSLLTYLQSMTIDFRQDFGFSQLGS